MNRPLVGIIALVLLLLAALLWFWQPPDGEAWLSAFLRVGFVMGAMWLALPELQRIPHWAAKGLVVAGLLAAGASKPRVLIIGGGILLLVSLLKPRMAPEKPPQARRSGAARSSPQARALASRESKTQASASKAPASASKRTRP